MRDPLLIQLPTKIETGRLLLRPLKEDDSKCYFEACEESFDELTQYYAPEWSAFEAMPAPEYVADKVRQNIVSWRERSYLELAALDKTNGELVGVGQLHHLDWTVPKGRVGYFVRRGRSGQGYATEIANVMTRFAISVLKFERLEIRTEVRNIASGRIPRALGYEFQTVFRNNKRGRGGELWDMEIHVRHDLEDLPALEVKFA